MNDVLINDVLINDTSHEALLRGLRLHEVLQGLRLGALVAELPPLIEEARQRQLSYEAFLELVFTKAAADRADRARERRYRQARLPMAARLENFDFRFQPSVSERLVGELAQLTFLASGTNVVLLGPPGVGKTHLACALAAKALDAGYGVRFATLRDLAEAIMDDPGVVARYAAEKLMVIDEVGYTRLHPEQAHGLFDLVTARYERTSTILTSNLSFAEWGTLLGDEVLATALLDRLLHHAEVISINGRSYRMRRHMEGDHPSATPQPGGSNSTVDPGQK